MVKGGMAGYALVIGSETFSRILDWEDRATCVLFGDGAGALVLKAEETEDQGILATRLHADGRHNDLLYRSEEHTSELQSLMRISYAVFCLKKKQIHTKTTSTTDITTQP